MSIYEYWAQRMATYGNWISRLWIKGTKSCSSSWILCERVADSAISAVCCVMVGGQKENGICVVAKGPICTSKKVRCLRIKIPGISPGDLGYPQKKTKNATLTLRGEHDDKLWQININQYKSWEYWGDPLVISGLITPNKHSWGRWLIRHPAWCFWPSPSCSAG